MPASRITGMQSQYAPSADRRRLVRRRKRSWTRQGRDNAAEGRQIGSSESSVGATSRQRSSGRAGGQLQAELPSSGGPGPFDQPQTRNSTLLCEEPCSRGRVPRSPRTRRSRGPSPRGSLAAAERLGRTRTSSGLPGVEPTANETDAVTPRGWDQNPQRCLVRKLRRGLFVHLGWSREPLQVRPHRDKSWEVCGQRLQPSTWRRPAV